MKEGESDFYQTYYKNYLRYFIQYPGIYQLLFIEVNSVLRNDKELINKIINIPKTIKENYNPNEDQYFHQVNGLLFLYLNRSYPITYKDFIDEFDKIFNKV